MAQYLSLNLSCVTSEFEVPILLGVSDDIRTQAVNTCSDNTLYHRPSASCYLTQRVKVTYRNENVWNFPCVLLPSLAISLATSVMISSCAMHDHDGEEYWVEPRERRTETCDETPVEREIDVARVVDFAGFAVCSESAQHLLSQISSQYSHQPLQRSFLP